MGRLRLVLPAALAALAVAAPAAHAQAPAPSLTADTAFAPPTGIARLDFATGTVADVPSAVAVHGERIYTVGRTQGGSGGQDIGIMAQRRDGMLDPGFSGDGKLIVCREDLRHFNGWEEPQHQDRGLGSLTRVVGRQGELGQPTRDVIREVVEDAVDSCHRALVSRRTTEFSGARSGRGHRQALAKRERKRRLSRPLQ